MTIKDVTGRVQLGDSATATNNFVLDSSAANGTMKLARGTAGATTQDVLTVDASGVITAPQGLVTNRLVLGSAQASTSGTAIDFTGIPSWVKRITVMFSGVSTNGASNFQIQLGSGSVTTSGYTSYCLNFGAGAGAASVYTTGFGIKSTASTMVVSGAATFSLSGSNAWVGTLSLGSPTNDGFLGAGSVTLSGTLDRVRITTINGTDTFDAGSINILYEG